MAKLDRDTGELIEPVRYELFEECQDGHAQDQCAEFFYLDGNLISQCSCPCHLTTETKETMTTSQYGADITYQECDLCEDSDQPWKVLYHRPDCTWFDPNEYAAVDKLLDLDEVVRQAKAKGEEAGTKLVKASTPAKWFSCRHALDHYELSDGTGIFLSGYSDRHGRTWTPDFAVYLDDDWDPDTIAYNLPWKDYGLSWLRDDQVLWIAQDVLAKAQAGTTVEVGCYGGHGRTGTFVALLDLLTMERPNADEAIKALRRFYCQQAIESEVQEWWLAAMAADMNGEERPVKPEPKQWVTASTTTTTDQAKQGAVMYVNAATGKTSKQSFLPL